MSKTMTFERVREVICNQLSLNDYQVKPESDIKTDLATDSLDCIEILMSTEDEFDISIKDEDAEACKTVQDVVNLVDRLVKDK